MAVNLISLSVIAQARVEFVNENGYTEHMSIVEICLLYKSEHMSMPMMIDYIMRISLYQAHVYAYDGCF